MKMSSTVAHSESEVQNKMTSEESPIFESDLPKEGRCPNSELSMKTETEDPACSNGEAEKNVKIKEEAAEIDVGLQNEDACSSANHGDVCGIFPKVMIKVEGEEEEEEEPWCQERAFPCNPEAPSVSDCQIYNVTKLQQTTPKSINWSFKNQCDDFERLEPTHPPFLRHLLKYQNH